MTVMALIISVLVALGVIIAGGATKKAFIYALGAFIGVLLVGFLVIFIIVNSPFWTM